MSFAILNCELCKGKLREIIDLGFHPPTLGFTASRPNEPKTLYPLRISRCERCGLVQSGFATDPKILWGGEYFYESGATVSFKKHLDGLAERMIQYSPHFGVKPKFVVDIGSNDGTSLLKYQEAGIEVLGVDPSSVGAKAKVPTLNEFFSETLVTEKIQGQADLITCFNTFAHVANLDSFMFGVKWLLNKGGVFLTESQYLVDIVEKLGYDTMYLEHLRYYSVHTMISLLGRWGLEVFDVERTPSIGGSILVYARAGSRSGGKRVEELLKLEDDVGLQRFETYADFAQRVRQNRADLNSTLWELKRQGNRIVGIGAPGRSTTIINYCGLGPDLIDYLVETSALKIGRFSPGVEIPVVGEEKFLKDQPDYAVNFLWHLPQIAEKLRAKGFRGKVIEPLPKVKIT